MTSARRGATLGRTTGTGAALCVAALALGPLATSSPAAGAVAGATCGGTVTTSTTLTADLTCADRGLRLRPGVVLDLDGHTLRVKGTGPAIAVVATGGARTTTEVRDGVVRGGGGITITGTDDASDDGRVQRLRVVGVTLDNAALDVVDAVARVEDSTVTRSRVRQDAGSLQVVDSALSGVVTSDLGDTGFTNSWSVTRSRISGSWWRGGHHRVARSRITDTSTGSAVELASLTISRSMLNGPRFPLQVLGDASITHTDVTGAGTIATTGSLTVGGSTFRRTAGLAGDRATGTVTVTLSTFLDSTDVALSGALVRVTGSVFRDNEQAISGDSVDASRNTFTDNGGAVTVLGQRIRARDNTLRNNAGDGIRTSAGLLQRNDVRGQQGDAIAYTEPLDPGWGDVRLGENTVIGNGGWGIHAPGDLVHDLGGNVARNNGAGQCLGVACAPH